MSRLARSTPEVREILSRHAAGEVIPALEKSAASQQFLADLHKWLAYYGQRLNSAFALGEPSWIEDPTLAIQNLQAYVAMPDLRPEMEPAVLAAERETSVAEARARIQEILATRQPLPLDEHIERELDHIERMALESELKR